MKTMTDSESCMHTSCWQTTAARRYYKYFIISTHFYRKINLTTAERKYYNCG